MKRIDTPTRQLNKFGAGLDGYNDVPPANTQLSGAALNHIQEELARSIEDQGGVLDAGNYGQLAEHLASLKTTGAGSVESGGSLTIKSGATLQVDVGGVVTCDGGLTVTTSVADFQAGIMVSGAAGTFEDGLTVSGGPTNLGAISTDFVTVNGDATFKEKITLADNKTFTGGTGTSVTAEVMAPTEVRWVDSGNTLPGLSGNMRWNGTHWSFVDAANVVRTFEEAARGFDATFFTVNAIDDTGAFAARRIKPSEPVWIEVSTRFACTTAPSYLNYRMKIMCSLGTVDVDIDTYRVDTANAGYSFARSFYWTPTDDFLAIAEDGYLFTVRIGRSSGSLTATNVSIKASNATQV